MPLFKSGSRDEASSFRPISILSVLSKICEKVVCRQVSDHLIENNLLAPTQYAYRKSHSTEDALIDVTDWMVRRMDEGSGVARISSRRGPNFMGAPRYPLTKTENLSDLTHYFLEGAQFDELKKNQNVRFRGPSQDGECPVCV